MRRPFVVLVLLILLSLTLAFSSLAVRRWSERTGKVETVHLMTGPPSVEYLPQYIARARGFFKEQGVDVKIENTATAETLMAALESGRADVVLTGLEQAIYRRAEGSTAPVAFAALTARDTHFLVARAGKHDFQWADLKGKSVIAGWPESRETVLLEGILRQNKIAPNREVTLYTNIPASLRPGAFQAGSGDYILVAEPRASQMEARGQGKVVASLGSDAGPLPGVVYVTTKQFLQTRPGALQRFTNAVYQAQLWLAHHSAAEAAALAGPYLNGIDQGLLTQAVERYHRQETWAATPVIPVEGYNYLMGLLDQSREVRRVVPAGEMVDNRFAGRALETVKYDPGRDEKRRRSIWRLPGI
ncbi:MAG: ABC transporter substrate-binding protein [Thermoanaerobacteraceae bacterium]|nr:ABC transporter substrate-binding protein [Thermoanaerobacteraceae bacterium]